MSTSPFKIKEVTKEKELQKEKEDLKVEKPEKDKHEKEKNEKEKHEKETKESKDVKDKQEKEKHEKEKSEKEHKPEKAEKLEHKEKPEKIEELEKFKFEKTHVDVQQAEQQMMAPQATAAALPTPIHKVHKDFYKEYFKEYIKEKPEKLEYEVAGPVGGFGPGPEAASATEARIASLEATVAQLMHFIPESMRPDLTKGALKNEPAEPAAEPSEAKEKEKGKK